MSCIEFTSSLSFTLLTAPTQETYTLWNSKDKNRKTLMNEDRITELYRENVYTKLSPDQPFASISVSEDGFVAFADAANCRVYNPYQNCTLCLSNKSEGPIQEEGEKSPQKRVSFVVLQLHLVKEE